jgi:hypothetical protein
MKLKAGAWNQESVVLVGGGPSLKTFDWSILRRWKERVIVVNRAFIDVPTADLFFTEDARFITRFAREYSYAWKTFKGLKVWNCLSESEIPEVLAVAPEIQILTKKRDDKFWSTSFEEGLGYSSNSMVGAMNIAWLMGGEPLYLLGVDARTSGLRMENYHTDYRSDPMWEVGANAADNFKNDFEGWVAPHVKDRVVLNLVDPDPDRISAITSWPRVDRDKFFQSRFDFEALDKGGKKNAS